MTTKELLNKVYKGSYYTIIGAGGDLNEWKKGYQDMLTEQGIGEISEWVTFTGKDVNEHWDLAGDNAFKDGLTFLAFSLNGLEVGKLAMFKLRMQDRWFDDVINNTLARQNGEA